MSNIILKNYNILCKGIRVSYLYKLYFLFSHVSSQPNKKNFCLHIFTPKPNTNEGIN